MALSCLGKMLHGSGNLQGARVVLDEALALYREIDDPTWSTGAFLSRGLLASAQGDYVDPCTQIYAGGRLCNGTCVDLHVDPNNCGACGRVCTGPVYSGACVWGGCWIS